MANLQTIEAKNDELIVIAGELSASIQALQQQISALNLVATDPVAAVDQVPYIIESGPNMFGYTGTNNIPIEDAFILATGIEDIMDRIEIVKDQAGIFWVDSYAMLTSLQHGKGYFIRNNGEPFSVTWS